MIRLKNCISQTIVKLETFCSSISLENQLYCLNYSHLPTDIGLPWWLSGKESAANAEDTGYIPGSGRSPREGNGNTLKYSCLGNPTDRGAWQAIVHGVAKSQTQLND